MKKFKTYKMTGSYKGIDDLKSIYAFLGNSQGDTSVSNDIDVYKSSNDWMCISKYFKDIDCSNQEEINKRSLELKKENDEYIKLLHQTKEFGKYNGDIEITMLEDTNNKSKSNLVKKESSFVMDFIDFNKIKKVENMKNTEKFNELLEKLKKLKIIQTKGDWSENLPDDIWEQYFKHNFKEVKRNLDIDIHRWYETSITVIEIYGKFLGIRYITNVYADSVDWEDCYVEIKFMEMKEIQTISYECI